MPFSDYSSDKDIWDFADKILLFAFNLELIALYLFFSPVIFSDFISNWLYSDTDVSVTANWLWDQVCQYIY